jgi:hypothetical protein
LSTAFDLEMVANTHADAVNEVRAAVAANDVVVGGHETKSLPKEAPVFHAE